MKKYIIILLLLFPLSINAETIAEGESYNAKWTLSDDGTLNIECKTVGQSCVMKNYAENSTEDFRRNKSQIKKVILSDDLDNVGTRAFENFENLEEVILPKSMGDEIGDYAFYNCTKLKEIEMPDHFERIGAYALYGTSITKVELSKFTNWIEDHAFNDDTVVTHEEGYDDLYAAGTAGSVKTSPTRHELVNINNHTCENEYYYTSYYDDTIFWELTKDGTLTIYGSGPIENASPGSRVPWGCWKDKIKKIVINKQKDGTLIKTDKTNQNKKLSNAVYGIYINKTQEEIEKNSITGINQTLLQDCSFDCKAPEFLSEIKISNEVKTISEKAFNASDSTRINFTNITIPKTVTSIGNYLLSNYTNINFTINLEVSYEDYVKEGYNYEGYVEDGKFKEILSSNNPFNNEIGHIYLKSLADEYYEPVHNDKAEKTIEINGKTYYLYTTVKTKADGSVNFTLLDSMEDAEYYVKEVTAPSGYQIDPEPHKIDTTNKKVQINVSNYPIGYKEPTQDNNQQEEKIEDVKTGSKILSYAIIFLVSIIALVLGIQHTKRKAFLNNKID